MTSFPQLEQRIYEASNAIDHALDELERMAGQSAAAEMFYRESQAKALLRHTEGKSVDVRRSEAEQEVFPDPETGEVLSLSQVRYNRDLKEKLYFSSQQAVKARSQQLSALQSLARKESAEADLARFDQRGVA